MNIRDIYNGIRAGIISEHLAKGENLTHTINMVYYAEEDDLEECKRKKGLLEVIGELSLVYKENKNQIHKCLYEAIENGLACAVDGVEERGYWDSIMHVFNLETIMLKGYIPKLPSLDSFIPINSLLERKMARGRGIYTYEQQQKQKMRKHEIDPADWWKRGEKPRFNLQ